MGRFNGILPILVVVMVAFVVESPRYLLGKGQLKKATKALVCPRRIEAGTEL